MCNAVICDERLGLGPDDESLDFRDAEDKQWYIECKTLELEELKLKVQLAEAEEGKLLAQARIIEAKAQEADINKELELARIQNPQGEPSVVLEADCAYCGSTFKYRGDDNDLCDTMYSRFCDVHDPCGRR